MFKVRTKKFLRTFILCVLSVVTVIHPVSAISETTLRHFAENNIIFYDPDADSTKCVPKNNSETYNSTKPSSNEITWIGDSYSVGAKSLINKKFGGDVDFGIGKSDPIFKWVNS